MTSIESDPKALLTVQVKSPTMLVASELMLSTFSYVDALLTVTVWVMLYVVPSTVSVTPSLVHVTVVAGEPVEVQVRASIAGLNSRLVTSGGAGEWCRVRK